jgi:hypothetical protein
MQFGFIEDGGWGHGPIDKMAALFIGCVLIALIYHFISMLIDYSRLRRQGQQLGRILRTQFAAGKWDPTVSSWAEIKDPHLSAIAETLRQELSGQGPLAVIAALKQPLNLLSGRFMRMVRRMQALGWSTCLVGWIGASSLMHDGFRGLAIVGSAKGFDVASISFADAFRLQICGLVVGLACLAISSFGRNRLHVLLQDLSNRVLSASTKKGA